VTANTNRGRLGPYPRYKDSGVEWLGEIPAGWEVKRLRFVSKSNPVPSEVRNVPGDTEVSFVPMEAVGEHGGLTLETKKLLADVNAGYTYFRDGDVIIAKITPCFENGKGALAEGLTNGIAFGTTELHVLRTSSATDRRFAFYVTLSDAFRRLGAADMYGAGGQKRISESFVRDFPLALPSLPEQLAIATFLDRETARLDALVAKKERLITLLHERRTALITRAVTKGLDSAAPMRDSRVEWLGEIPAHWEVLTLKRRVRRIQTGSTPPTSETWYYEDGVVAWYGPSSFADDLPLQAPVKFLSNRSVTDGVARVFEPGSSVIVTIGATIGKVAYMSQAGSCNQQITGITFDDQRVDARYGAYQLKRLEPVLRGIAPNTTLPILDQSEIGYLRFVVPPMDEQVAVRVFLDCETLRIDDLTNRIRTAITRLHELRTALISAAVTGKIDVREAAQ
jgi:type I restriction enzyme S subunit